jgi:gamma-butyrobetaine dioxygenase
MLALEPTARDTVSTAMADLAPMHTECSIVSVSHDASGVTLEWDDGRRSRFRALWLRDNCACVQCRHPKALERTHTFVDHAGPTVTAAALGPDQSLEVRFRAGEEAIHTSRYTKAWLRTYDPEARATRPTRRAPDLWGADIATRLPSVDYASYMQTDGGLRAWIEAVQAQGIVLLRGVPPVPGALRAVARRIGAVRPTNFGESYDVVSMPNPNASAYTAMGLELHTDLANWRTPPDVQLLSCVKSTVRGGESVFADGFRVATDLRAAEPHAFELLSRWPLEFRFHDESCDIRTNAATFELDRDGQLAGVRFNNWLRGPLAAPDDIVGPLYVALGTFWGMLRDEKYRLNLRLEAGDLVAYDNHRILHGRAAFDPTTGERHLQGCYLYGDDVDSALRLLDRSRRA